MKAAPPRPARWSLATPAARTDASYDLDAVALPAFVAAIAYSAALLSIPHPLIVAGAIVLVCLIGIDVLQFWRGVTPRRE
jgi:uncharacterized membrane protein